MREIPCILFENNHYIAAHKPAWWLTHPSNEARQIKQNLMAFIRNLIDQFVYPVNRLDLQSSGIVLFAKDKQGVTKLQQFWHSDKTTKRYLALVHGHLDTKGEFTFPLSGENKILKDSHTLYQTILYYKNQDCSLVEVEIKTGRRHQIRRHFSRRMHALIGDRKYGKKIWNDPFRDSFGLDRLFLHATFLQFEDPYSSEIITINDPLPQELQSLLDQL